MQQLTTQLPNTTLCNVGPSIGNLKGFILPMSAGACSGAYVDPRNSEISIWMLPQGKR